MRTPTMPVCPGLWMAALVIFAACGAGDATEPQEACEDPAAVDAQDATDLYLAAWGEDDSHERSCLLHRSLAPDAVLIEDAGPIEGRAAIVAELDAQITELFDTSSRRDEAGPTAIRHDEARVQWRVTRSSGPDNERGEDWLEFNEAGLLTQVHVLSGAGAEAPVNAPLLAWQRAWNADDETSRSTELRVAATDDIRFTDFLADVHGRDALEVEIGRQQETIGAQLRLDDRIEVFASDTGEPLVVRLGAQLVMPNGNAVRVVDYIRLREGRLERLSGFPAPAP